MVITVQYNDLAERDNLLTQHQDKYLIAEKNIREGNFLVFTDFKPIETEIAEIKQTLADIKQSLTTP